MHSVTRCDTILIIIPYRHLSEDGRVHVCRFAALTLNVLFCNSRGNRMIEHPAKQDSYWTCRWNKDWRVESECVWCCCSVKDSRTALHETCRSPSDAEQDLRDIAQLLIEAGADLNSKAVDAGEVRLSVCVSVCLSVCLSVHLFACVCWCLSFYKWIEWIVNEFIVFHVDGHCRNSHSTEK